MWVALLARNTAPDGLLALERETRKILAWVLGDCSKKTAKRLWEALPHTCWQKRDAV
jgi:IS1 family transposase